MRPLSKEERSLIFILAGKLADRDRARLLADLDAAMAHPATPDGSRIVFELAGYTRPAYRGQHTYGVEGRMLDRDGVELSVLIHADECGRLLELEFVRWDSNDLLEPRWDTLEVH